MKKDLFVVTLRTLEAAGGGADILRGIFENIGFAPSAISESSNSKYLEVSVYLKLKSAALTLKRKIKGLRLQGVRCLVKKLAATDWQDRWKKQIKPFCLTRELIIVPVWCRPGVFPKRLRPIFINTTMAFGTGLHETTRFMSRLIRDCRGQFDTFLDVGTGTGLLSMVAAHYGAKKILAIDMDPLCIGVARGNFEINHLHQGKVKRIEFSRFKPNGQFDFVAANLVSMDLIKFRRQLIRCVQPRGFLAISGISRENLRQVKESFRNKSLRCVKILQGRTWAAILYRRC